MTTTRARPTATTLRRRRRTPPPGTSSPTATTSPTLRLRSLLSMAATLMTAFLVTPSSAAVHLHWPRGSLNRLDEDTSTSDNTRRLFDTGSVTARRGGYNVGDGNRPSLQYYPGSTLPIMWTTSQACGVDVATGERPHHCTVVLQYMCDTKVRDGTDTSTVPDTRAGDADARFGRHESRISYQDCVNTQRNKGLFHHTDHVTADGADNTMTTGATGPQRHGFECAEELEYYPYWRNSEWRDIAIITDTPERCPALRAESQNVKPRAGCVPNDAPAAGAPPLPISQAACTALPGVWNTQLHPAHGVAAPECIATRAGVDYRNGQTSQFTLDDDVRQSVYQSYNWTLPDTLVNGDRCVVRVRVNITANVNQKGNYGFADTTTLAPATDTETLDGALYPAARGYQITRGQLTVAPFAAPASLPSGAKMPTFLKEFASDYNPHFRVHQDRSHTLNLARPGRKTRPGSTNAVHNVAQIGRRGNMQQVYPSLVYDTWPNRLHAKVGDYVHFQWTGSDNNPATFSGSGSLGEDRHNVVMIAPPAYAKPGQDTRANVHGAWGRLLPVESVTAPTPFLGWPAAKVDELACASSSPSHYDADAQKLTSAARGTWYYMCTLNNYFGHRSQKAVIYVKDETGGTGG